MRRLAFPAIVAGISCLLVLSAIPSSPGTAVRQAASRYIDALASGDQAAAHSMLTDSLAGLLAPEALLAAPVPGASGPPMPGRTDERGLAVTLPVEGGGARTIWLVREDGGYAVSGDTFIDWIMGSAAVICREHALEILPSVSAGSDAGDFACPLSGLPYEVAPSTGRLLCPAGHLGDGLETGGDACGAEREQVAGVVRGYIAAGHAFPLTFEEMWSVSSGEFGQPGGYRCPDNGYSYYGLRDSAVYCPFHNSFTPVLPVLSSRSSEGEPGSGAR